MDRRRGAPRPRRSRSGRRRETGVNSPARLVDDAVAAVGRRELIVLPTDTVYGIGSRPDDPEATARIFAAKGRPRDLELPVLVPDVDAAASIAVLDERAARLVEGFWPGPLTVVLERTDASRGWDLGG